MEMTCDPAVTSTAVDGKAYFVDAIGIRSPDTQGDDRAR
eukprot:gene16401-10707_t